MKKWSIEDFGGSETTQYVTAMMDTCRYTFVQTHRTYTTSANPNVNYELQMIMICQCSFTDCNKCTILVGAVENGGGCACVGAGDLWEFPYCLLNVAVNAKLL